MSLPTTYRTPIFSVGFDSTRASKGPSILQYQVLIVGGRRSTGSVAALVKKRILSVADARTFWGEGSEMHLMAKAYLAIARHVPVYGIALDDHASGIAATKTITVSGPSTAAGNLYLMIGGRAVTVAVASGASANTIASSINTAIAATEDLPVTAGVSSAVVTTTARNKGEAGQDVDIRVNYNESEVYPTGVSVAIANGTAGAQNPDITTVFTAIGEEWFNIIIGPYVDTTNLGIIETELADRFGEIRMIPAQYICSKDANASTLSTFGALRNSPHVRCAHSYGIPWTPFEYAAAWGATEAASAEADPAKPQFNQIIVGAKAPIVTERFLSSENNTVLYDGISTFVVDSGGNVKIQRAITMYQTNIAGASDDAYLRAETMYTLMYLRYSFRNWFLTRYPRAKLADDGTIIRPGDSVITPSIAKSEAIAWARSMESDKGLLENIDQFKRDLVVVRNGVDRLDFTAAPDTINQFVVGAATMQFIL